MRSGFARQRVFVSVGILCSALAVTMTVIWRANRVPRYDGKTVREWLVLLDSRTNQEANHNRATDAFLEIGGPAVAELERVLRRKPRSMRAKIREEAVRLRLLKAEKIAPEEEQVRAARASYILAEEAGVDIEPLIPYLAYHLTNSNYGDPENARALAWSGPGGISILTNLLASGDLHARGQAAWALHLVNDEPGVVRALIQAADDPERSIRIRALFSLRQASEAADRIVPVGLRFLQSLDPVERWAAANLLQAYASLEAVRTALDHALSDLDDRVRSVAGKALEESSEDPVE